MVRTLHKGATSHVAMQIPLSIIIHKRFSKAINESYCLQKRNKFHKETLPVKVNSGNSSRGKTMKNKA